MLRFALVLWLAAGVLFAKDKPDARLREVKKVFVAGNNEAAEKIRSDLRKDMEKRQGCLTLVTKPADADATLEVADDSVVRELGTRHDRVTATLTLKSGDLVWSHTDSWSDDPLIFQSGVKTAASAIYNWLKKDACR
ncbi:MAG: hypothetical protein JWO19_1932 [Bryobacterales bacterium]|nr:hypothetical protein [Bryobacterales bacterium]